MPRKTLPEHITRVRSDGRITIPASFVKNIKFDIHQLIELKIVGNSIMIIPKRIDFVDAS